MHPTFLYFSVNNPCLKSVKLHTFLMKPRTCNVTYKSMVQFSGVSEKKQQCPPCPSILSNTHVSNLFKLHAFLIKCSSQKMPCNVHTKHAVVFCLSERKSNGFSFGIQMSLNMKKSAGFPLTTVHSVGCYRIFCILFTP